MDNISTSIISNFGRFAPRVIIVAGVYVGVNVVHDSINVVQDSIKVVHHSINAILWYVNFYSSK